MQGLGARIARRSHASPLAGGILSRGSCTKLFVGVPVMSERSVKHVYAKAQQSWNPLLVDELGLSYDTNEPVLKDAFRQFGDIIEVKVICDHVSGKSKGYGFVRFESEAAASTALNEMDGKSLDGRDIRVHYAQKRNGGL